jgi:hypothetical protein
MRILNRLVIQYTKGLDVGSTPSSTPRFMGAIFSSSQAKPTVVDGVFSPRLLGRFSSTRAKLVVVNVFDLARLELN